MPLTRNISVAFGASALACVAAAFVWGYEHNHNESETDELAKEVDSLIRSGQYNSAISLLQDKQQTKN
jgi:hypothetical protein